MVNTTLPDSDENKTISSNESDELFNRVYGDDVARGQEEAENASATGGSDQKTSVDDLESNPENPTRSNQSWRDNVVPKQTPNLKVKSLWKRRGPLIVIGGGLGLGGLAVFLLLVPGILLFHILANAFGTLDPSSTALTEVTKTMLMNKLGANDATIGACNVIKIACRFKTPSNELLRELKASGITALDSGGNPINLDTDATWPSERPSSFKISSFATDSGEELTIAAKDLKGALESNTLFRLGFNKVVKSVSVRAFSRFSPAFLKVMDKFHFGLTDKLNIKERITEKGKALVGDVLEKSVDSLFGEGTAASAKGITSTVTVAINKALTRIDKLSKGSGVVLAMAAQCMVNQLPSMLKGAMVGVQQSAAVNIASPIVTSISAIKAGDGDSDTASEIGTMFTQTDSSGNSALSSAGMQYILNGSKDTTTDSTYKTVTPAAFGDLGSLLDTSNAVLNNPVSAGACQLITNPITGAAVAAGINSVVTASGGADFGASLILNWGLGEAFSLLINSTSGFISNTLGSFFSSGVGDLAQSTVSKLTQPGETFGNVFTFGVNLMTANTGGNTFAHYATTDQLPTLTANIQQQQLADAQLDRATLSPFDTSSPYTFMGSIMNQLTPYYSSFSSIGGSLSTLGSLLPISFGSILKLSTANAADTSLYDGACPDPSQMQTNDGSGKTLAGTIDCLPVPDVTVPSDWNPSDTEASMETMQTDGTSEIDSNTGLASVPGNAVEQTVKDTVDSVTSLLPGATLSYGDYLDTCSDPANAASCAGTDATSETYSLYTAANTVSVMLDDNIPAAQSAAGTPSDGSTTSTDPSTSADSLIDSTDNSVATTGISFTQTLASLGSLISPIHDLLRAYGSTLFPQTSSSQLSALQTLEGFSLWG